MTSNLMMSWESICEVIHYGSSSYKIHQSSMASGWSKEAAFLRHYLIALTLIRSEEIFSLQLILLIVLRPCQVLIGLELVKTISVKSDSDYYAYEGLESRNSDRDGTNIMLVKDVQIVNLL